MVIAQMPAGATLAEAAEKALATRFCCDSVDVEEAYAALDTAIDDNLAALQEVQP